MAYSSSTIHPFSLYGLTTEEAYHKLDAEIAKTQTYLYSLRALRNSLPPIAHIPTEILSTVFTCCQDDIDPSTIEKVDTKTRFSVSWVCRHWRNTALATPALWTVIRAKNAEDPALAKLLIDRSGTSNLFISITAPGKEVLTTCLSVLPRIQNFKWDASTATPLSAWTYKALPELFSRAAPRLSSLELVKFQFQGERALFAATYPQLRSVTLQSCKMGSLPQLLAPTLTRLRITRIDYTNFTSNLLNILPSLQNLEELAIENCPLESIPKEPINLPGLKLLYLEDLDCFGIFAFLGYFDIPQACITVLWDEVEEELDSEFEPEFLPAFESYLLRKGFPVRSLEIHYLDIGVESGKHSNYTINISTDLLTNRHSIQFEPPELEPADKITALVCGAIPMDELESFTTVLFPPPVSNSLSGLTTLKTITLLSDLDLGGLSDFISGGDWEPPEKILFRSLKKLILQGINLEMEPTHVASLYDALKIRQDAGLGLDQLEFFNCSNVDKEQFVPVVRDVNVLPVVPDST